MKGKRLKAQSKILFFRHDSPGTVCFEGSSRPYVIYQACHSIKENRTIGFGCVIQLNQGKEAEAGYFPAVLGGVISGYNGAIHLLACYTHERKRSMDYACLLYMQSTTTWNFQPDKLEFGNNQQVTCAKKMVKAFVKAVGPRVIIENKPFQGIKRVGYDPKPAPSSPPLKPSRATKTPRGISHLIVTMLSHISVYHFLFFKANKLLLRNLLVLLAVGKDDAAQRQALKIQLWRFLNLVPWSNQLLQINRGSASLQDQNLLPF